MLKREEIQLAVELQRRSYNLVRWLSSAVAKGVIYFDRAHDYMDEAEAAEEWIRRHYENLPPDCRPSNLDQLTPFAKFSFASKVRNRTWIRVSTTCGSGWVNHQNSKSSNIARSSLTHPLPQVVLTRIQVRFLTFGAKLRSSFQPI
jgi:hypothetical protein